MWQCPSGTLYPGKYYLMSWEGSLIWMKFWLLGRSQLCKGWCGQLVRLCHKMSSALSPKVRAGGLIWPSEVQKPLKTPEAVVAVSCSREYLLSLFNGQWAGTPCWLQSGYQRMGALNLTLAALYMSSSNLNFIISISVAVCLGSSPSTCPG